LLSYLSLLADKRKDRRFIMAELTDTEFIVQMARAVVEEVAPEELASFPLIAEAYEMNPESLRTSKADGEVEMGMSPGELLTTWTPTILLLLQQAVLQGGKAAATDEAKRLFTGIFGRVSGLWHAKSKKLAMPLPAHGQDLNREELQTLRTYFYETAVEFGVKDPKARQIAECVVGKWATRTVNK
jgi:hypothetical protein